MTRQLPRSFPLHSWIILTASLAGILGFASCAKMSTLMGKQKTSEAPESSLGSEVTAKQPTPPKLQEVQEAIASTKTLLDNHQTQIGELLTLRGEVKQTLREFRDQNLTPMHTALDTLEHQVANWEETVANNQTAVASSVAKLTKDFEQSQTQVAIYGDQVTALVDQIDQNNQHYGKLLTEFQDSLVGFKAVMDEFHVTLASETTRATKEEGTLANRLREQQQTLDQVETKTKEILVLQKRLNQLHTYINQVRDTVTSDTMALRASLNPETTDNLKDLITSLEERYQELAQAPPQEPVPDSQLQALETRVEESEKTHMDTINALRHDIQTISTEMQNTLESQSTDNLRDLVVSLEERYQQLSQTPSKDAALTQHLQALEQRVDQYEQHHTETLRTLQHDIQEISTGMQANVGNEATDNLRERVVSLEQGYQRLAKTPTAAPVLTSHLQALEQRMEQSEKDHAESVNALQHDIQEISAGMQTLAKSISIETVEALHHDIQEVSAGMMKLAQSINHLQRTNNTSKAIHTESRSTPPQTQQE